MGVDEIPGMAVVVAQELEVQPQSLREANSDPENEGEESSQQITSVPTNVGEMDALIKEAEILTGGS